MNININIENLTIHIGDVSEEPHTDHIFDEDWLDEDFTEEAAAAEETLYEAQDEEVTPSYWDEAVDAAVKQPTFAPKSLVEVLSGYKLVGRVGRVRLTDDNGYILVEFDGYDNGHDGDLNDGATSRRWFFTPTQLEPYSLKVGDKVRHMGDGTGEVCHDTDHAYAGYKGESLVGKVGTVVATDGILEGEVLVEWEDWTDGHGMRAEPHMQSNKNRWFTMSDNLNKVEQWN